MQTIIGVKFKSSPKSYYFDPKEIDFDEGDGVIVETAKGVEYGTVVIANRELGENEKVPPLKPVIRKATEADAHQLLRNAELRQQAFGMAEPKIEQMNPEMKLVDIEYTFDQNKVIFYYTADGRVDFRELVRTLAAVFHRRIEMRQIDEREDFKMRGCLASCGRECCCAAGVSDFEKVSIKMAKVQGLPLNPTKISGMCGKLMCCLKYENEYYAETSKLMPKKGAEIETPDGRGKVEDLDMLRRTCTVRIEKQDGVERKKYTLAELKLDKNAHSAPENDDTDE